MHFGSGVSFSSVNLLEPVIECRGRRLHPWVWRAAFLRGWAVMGKMGGRAELFRV